MALNLIDSFGKSGVSYGLLTSSADVIDTDYASKYFIVSELSPKFTAGRNALAFNGSIFLKPGSEVLIECLDASGANLFVEMALSTNSSARTFPYKEATAFVFSIHVYGDTTDGVGRLILYGTLNDGRTVKWSRNITIDKSLQNSSKVRFYNRPILEVDSVEVPVLSANTAAGLNTSVTFTGTVHGSAVIPPKDTNLPTVNRRNLDVDYRLIVDSPPISSSALDINAINSQMLNAIVQVSPITVQAPLSTTSIPATPSTQSYIISNIFNNNTLNIIDPFFVTDTLGNQIVTNIDDANISITYPYITYNNASASYLQTNINGQLITIEQSYADLIYRNIRTFTGFLARHKVYRKSLLSNADFSVIADEPLFVNEILMDNLTQNKFFDLLGKFYNQQHINHYWFTSSNNISLVHTQSDFIDSMQIQSPIFQTLTGSDYAIVKNDSVGNDRDAVYIPFDDAQFSATSGSAYDSNFMALKANVQYIFQVSSVVVKDPGELAAEVDFYFTSSVSAAAQDPNFTPNFGIKIATLLANQAGSRRIFDGVIFFYTPPADLYGTLVIVPKKCQPFLKDMSFRVYGDSGFSPDVFVSRIPWPISVAGETFQIKSELFDINHNLVYSDLQTVQNFDPSGSTLVPFIPGGNTQPGTFDQFISGSLFVSKSAFIETGNIVVEVGNIFIPNLGTQPRNNLISASRFVSVREDSAFAGELVINPVVDIGHDNNYVFVATGSLGANTINSTVMTANPVLRKNAIASNYAAQFGGHIYFNGSTKVEERPNSY